MAVWKYSIAVNLTLPLFDDLGGPAVQPALPGAAGVAPAGGPAGPADLADTAGGDAGGKADDSAASEPDALGPCPADLPDPLRAVLRSPRRAGGAGPLRGVLADPGALHPALWRASQVGGGRRAVTASGFATLDAQLPGQGWPHGELTELLLAQPGIGELRLLAPALAAIGGAATGAAAAAGPGMGGDAGAAAAAGVAADGPRCIMLFEPPATLSAWALAQQGLDHRHWLVVRSRAGQRPGQRTPRTPSGLSPLLPSADLLWALEQALRSGQVGAVLAWLPAGLGSEALRRLQLAAQAHDGPVFLFREAQAQARHRPSPAPLRLLLQPHGVDGLVLRLIKRRGPPLAEPLRLVLPSVLTPHQQARALAQQAVQGAVHSAEAVRRAGASGRVGAWSW